MTTAAPEVETAERVEIKTMDDFLALKEKVEKKQEKSEAETRREVEEQTLEEIDLLSAADYVEQEIVLPAGWRLVEWNQGMLMNIYEDGQLQKALDGGFDNRWRRNYEVVSSVLEHGGFGVTAVTPEQLLEMHWQDVEEIYHGIVAHYQNTLFIKKK